MMTISFDADARHHPSSPKSSYIINIIFIDSTSPAYQDGPMKTLSRLYTYVMLVIYVLNIPERSKKIYIHTYV